MGDGREVVERVRVGCDQYATCCARRRCDLKVVCSARATRSACVSKEGGVVAGDVEIEGDDVEGGEDRIDGRRASWTALRVG